MENHKVFLAAGGTRFSYVPALNISAEHVALLVDMINRHCQGWD
jgi:ferrochelatase